MRYLITGVSGFIGFHLAEKLCQDRKNTICGIDNINGYYSKKIKKRKTIST